MVTRTINYRKAIIVTRDRMTQLASILSEFFNRTEYTAILKNGNKESFEDVESLLLTDNYKDERIVAIVVYAHNVEYDNNNVAHLYFGSKEYISFFLEYSDVCRGSFTFDTKETANKFEECVNALIEKSTASYWAFAKVKLPTLLTIGGGIIYLYLLTNRERGEQTISLTMSSLVLILAVMLVAVWFVFFLNTIIHDTILPAAVFVWGEETTRSKRMESWRTNLLWVVIVGLILMIVGQKIIELLS